MYNIIHGSYDYTSLLCHTCKNKDCVNQNHLYLGSYYENAKDMADLGDGSKCKINFEIATIIRNKYKEIGEQNTQYVRKWTKDEFDIQLCNSAIAKILNNESYFDENYNKSKLDEVCNRKFNYETIKEIRNLYLLGRFTYMELSRQFNMSDGNIALIAHNKTWYSDEYEHQLKEAQLINKNIGEHHSNCKFSDETINQIRKLYLSGKNISTISKGFSLSRNHIYEICTNKVRYSKEYESLLEKSKITRSYGVFNYSDIL